MLDDHKFRTNNTRLISTLWWWWWPWISILILGIKRYYKDTVDNFDKIITKFIRNFQFKRFIVKYEPNFAIFPTFSLFICFIIYFFANLWLSFAAQYFWMNLLQLLSASKKDLDQTRVYSFQITLLTHIKNQINARLTVGGSKHFKEFTSSLMVHSY